MIVMEGGQMSTKRKHSKRRKQILETLIMTTFIALGAILILTVGHMFLNWSISKNQHSVEALSKEVSTLQEKIDATKNEQDEYKKQIDQLQAQLAKYQDVVIPESMQSDEVSS